jgi:hypothetical protein
VNRTDERMVEGGCGSRLAEQLLQAVSFAGRADELERNLPVEHHIVGETDLSHASAADDFDDLIAGLSRAERH